MGQRTFWEVLSIDRPVTVWLLLRQTTALISVLSSLSRFGPALEPESFRENFIEGWFMLGHQLLSHTQGLLCQFEGEDSGA